MFAELGGQASLVDATLSVLAADVDQSGHMDKNELLGFLYLLGIDGVCTSKEAVLRGGHGNHVYIYCVV